ncbi:MAG: ATP-binding protein [Planctomycetota bacterium]
MITALAVALFVYQLDRSATTNHRQQVHGVVVRDLAAVRGSVEVALNRYLHRLFALRSHVSINPEMTAEQFEKLSQLIMEDNRGIRSVTSIRDNVINDVYPREGNQGAIGLELLAHAKQRDAALHAIQTGKSWLAGPIKLVQGGEAFIYRSPVYRHIDPDVPRQPQDYWGMVSLLIDKETLVQEILTNVPEELEVTILGAAVAGNDGPTIAGDSDLAVSSSVRTSVTLPTGTWTLLGQPAGGWPETAPNAFERRVVGGSIAVVLGVLMFWVTGGAARDRRSAQQLALANDVAEAARQAAEFANLKIAEEADEIAQYADQLEKAQVRSARIMQELQHAQIELSESNTALKRSNEELEQFAFVASHDLQEPLRKVAAFCQLLELEYSDKFSEEGKRYLNYVIDGAHRMRHLIRDLLTFSKIQSMGEVLKPVDADQAVQDAIRSLEGSIDESSAIICTKPLPTVLGDQRLLTQLLQNLISNGIKYNQSDQPTIEVAAHRITDEDIDWSSFDPSRLLTTQDVDDESDYRFDSDRSPAKWMFTVTDNGIGIETEDHERVFGIFKRLHSQSDYNGTGIGLAICKRIAERLGGVIGVAHRHDGESGTTFYFVLEAAEELVSEC